MHGVRRGAVAVDGLGDEVGRQCGVLDRGDDPGRVEPGVDVDQHVELVEDPLGRSTELGDVPGPHLRRAVGQQLGFDLGWVGRQPPAFPALPGRPGDPIHRGRRAPVAALVELSRPDLADRQVRVGRGVDQREHRGPLGGRERLPVLGHQPRRSWTVHRPAGMAVVGGRGPAEQRADRLTGTAAARSSVNVAVIASSTTVACPCSRRCAPRALAVFR